MIFITYLVAQLFQTIVAVITNLMIRSFYVAINGQRDKGEAFFGAIAGTLVGCSVVHFPFRWFDKNINYMIMIPMILTISSISILCQSNRYDDNENQWHRPSQFIGIALGLAIFLIIKFVF
jgi:hypothetical protein